MAFNFVFVYPFFSGDAPALPLIIVTNICLFFFVTGCFTFCRVSLLLFGFSQLFCKKSN